MDGLEVSDRSDSREKLIIDKLLTEKPPASPRRGTIRLKLNKLWHSGSSQKSADSPTGGGTTSASTTPSTGCSSSSGAVFFSSSSVECSPVSSKPPERCLQRPSSLDSSMDQVMECCLDSKRMTSPAISGQKENSKSESISGTEEGRAAEVTAAGMEAAGDQPTPPLIAWWRVLKLAHLLMKQGC